MHRGLFETNTHYTAREASHKDEKNDDAAHTEPPEIAQRYGPHAHSHKNCGQRLSETRSTHTTIRLLMCLLSRAHLQLHRSLARTLALSLSRRAAPSVSLVGLDGLSLVTSVPAVHNARTHTQHARRKQAAHVQTHTTRVSLGHGLCLCLSLIGSVLPWRTRSGPSPSRAM